MGCNCRKKKSLEYMRKLAKVFSNVTKQDIQIYEYSLRGEKLYNFEPINNKRENVIEIIKCLEQE